MLSKFHQESPRRDERAVFLGRLGKDDTRHPLSSKIAKKSEGKIGGRCFFLNFKKNRSRYEEL